MATLEKENDELRAENAALRAQLMGASVSLTGSQASASVESQHVSMRMHDPLSVGESAGMVLAA
jgi:hypothetical protein